MCSLTSSVDRCEAARVIRCPIDTVHSLPHTFSFILPHRKGFGIRSFSQGFYHLLQPGGKTHQVDLYGRETGKETRKTFMIACTQLILLLTLRLCPTSQCNFGS